MNNQQPSTSCAPINVKHTAKPKSAGIKVAFRKTKHHLLPLSIVTVVTCWFIVCGLIVEGNYCWFFAERCQDGKVLRAAPFAVNAFLGTFLITICGTGAIAIVCGVLAVVFQSLEAFHNLVVSPTIKFFVEFVRELSDSDK